MILPVLDISIITCCLFPKYYLDCKYSQVIKVIIVFETYILKIIYHIFFLINRKSESNCKLLSLLVFRLSKFYALILKTHIFN